MSNPDDENSIAVNLTNPKKSMKSVEKYLKQKAQIKITTPTIILNGDEVARHVLDNGSRIWERNKQQKQLQKEIDQFLYDKKLIDDLLKESNSREQIIKSESDFAEELRNDLAEFYEY
jgi:hypothetical protein